jgi:hypothetical protein
MSVAAVYGVSEGRGRRVLRRVQEVQEVPSDLLADGVGRRGRPSAAASSISRRVSCLQ